MAQRSCGACGNPTKSARAKFCDGVECQRKRARERRREADARAGQDRSDQYEEPRAAGGVFAATLLELQTAGRVGTPAGQNALALATRIDFGASDTGSSVAALSKQHLAALNEAMAGVAATGDGLDELRKRREARGA